MTLDPTTTKLEREFKHARPLIGCRFDPSGRFLFASAEDNTIQRYDLLTGAKVAFVGHTSWVRSPWIGPHGIPLTTLARRALACGACEFGPVGVAEFAAFGPQEEPFLGGSFVE